MTGPCVVWAVSDYGGRVQERYAGPEEPAIRWAERIARSSAPEGAVSVWVESAQRVIWAAGVKAQEIIEAGGLVDADLRVGFVTRPPTNESETSDA